MKERPILMSAPMVVASLDDLKNQTRRVVKDQDAVNFMAGDPDDEDCPGLGLRWGQLQDDDGRLSAPQWLGYCADYPEEGAIGLGAAFGQPGDRLWVREAWRPDPPCDGTWDYTAWAGCREGQIAGVPDRFRSPKHCIYAAGWSGTPLRWTPSIHMPRWASRITLEVTGVRVERLHDISEADALAEGVLTWRAGWDEKTAATMFLHGTQARIKTNEGGVAKRLYYLLWEQIHGAGSWDANPMVWVVEFNRIKP